jgi:hypothetical protein
MTFLRIVEVVSKLCVEFCHVLLCLLCLNGFLEISTCGKTLYETDILMPKSIDWHFVHRDRSHGVVVVHGEFVGG